MNILQIAIIVFVTIEILNIMMLYFMPQSKMGNGVGVFNAYFSAQKDEHMKQFVAYLINWVAGAKLIFIMIGIVVVIFGNYLTQLFTVVALIISILSFYWRLFPSIKKMDKSNQITPNGYHKTLNIMIISFVLMFVSVLLIAVL